MANTSDKSSDDTAIHRRVTALRRGEDPTLIARLSSGWAVFGESQFLRGYSLLLPDPVVPHLNDFPDMIEGHSAMRAQFLLDLTRLGDIALKGGPALVGGKQCGSVSSTQTPAAAELCPHHRQSSSAAQLAGQCAAASMWRIRAAVLALLPSHRRDGALRAPP